MTKVLLAPNWNVARLTAIKHELELLELSDTNTDKEKKFIVEANAILTRIEQKMDQVNSLVDKSLKQLSRNIDDGLQYLYMRLTDKTFYTVEAEYGKNVLEGNQTLAHHVDKYKHMPAPCNQDVESIPKDSTIIISHIDLDTIGGVLALQGRKPHDPEFWKAAEYIDVKGAHHINDAAVVGQKDKLNAYFAWNFANRGTGRMENATDVTETIDKHAEAIHRIVNKDVELILNGKEWADDVDRAVEACLVAENELVRVFETPDVFCNAAYFSPNLGKIVPTTVVYNKKFGSITIAAVKPGFINVKEIVQKHMGPEAGGHLGIAGSPRNEIMSKPIAVDQEEFEYKDKSMGVAPIERILAGHVDGGTDFGRVLSEVVAEVEKKRDLITELNKDIQKDNDCEYER